MCLNHQPILVLFLSSLHGCDYNSFLSKILLFREIIIDMDKDIPKTAFITQFHALMLFKDRVKGVCLLNKRAVSV